MRRCWRRYAHGRTGAGSRTVTTITIAAYNRPEYLRTVLQSLLVALAAVQAETRKVPEQEMARKPEKEAVNHPSHYGGDVPHEVVKCLEAWGLESDALLWNAVKYISRAKKKWSTLEDLKKARWYLDRRIAQLERFAEGKL